jgi:hypothetical protein
MVGLIGEHFGLRRPATPPSASRHCYINLRPPALVPAGVLALDTSFRTVHPGIRFPMSGLPTPLTNPWLLHPVPGHPPSPTVEPAGRSERPWAV